MSLRIAFFVNWFPVISETFIYTSALSLLEAGHDVHIYALRGSGPAATERHRLWDDFDLASRTQKLDTQEVSWANAASAWKRAFQGLGTKAIGCLNILAHRTYLLRAETFFHAAMFRQRGEYDILHAQFSDLAHVVLRHRQAGLLSGRVITHFRGHDLTQTVATLGPRLHNEAFQKGDWFVANCQHFADVAVELGCPPERTSVVPSGIRIEDFPFAAKPPPASRRIRLLCVGRLTPHKGFMHAIGALAQLRAAGVDAELEILGDGAEQAALTQEVERLALQPFATMPGPANQEAVLAALHRADIFLAPSVTAPSGAQDAPVNVLKEAMLAGTPVVASRHGGIPELVRDGETGMLVAEGDAAALAHGIERCLKSAQAWPQMTATARRMVEQNYSTQKSCEDLLEVYAKCLSSEHRKLVR